MKKVELRIKEETKYLIIKKLVETNGNKKMAKTKSEKENIKFNIVAVEDAHPRQARCQYFGEEIQMDACTHLWFGDTKTSQQRLPQELRLAGITTIEEANQFLVEYIKKFNKQFALCINHNKSVFEKQLDEKKINLILSVLTKRVIDKGHSIKFNNKYYSLGNNNYLINL